ncbi:abortive infection family protein [Micromonospora profundi]|uniref:abortive infection family protein n=1 Tax=Micromonospora profundi TaxID=1420889 RepID=UPI003519DABA
MSSLSRLTQDVTELRNRVGVGHGRDRWLNGVRPHHARPAAGAAATWRNLMLETLGDPEAPWRI